MSDPEEDSTERSNARSRQTYKFKRKPYPHQVKAIRKALKRINEVGGFALLMEPRTGKTKVNVDIASILHIKGRVNRVLVLCPLGVMDVWEEEIKANCPVKYRITMWDKKGRKRQSLPPFGQDVLDFVIMNPDAWSTPGKREVKHVRNKETGRVSKVVTRSRTRGGKYDIKRALKRWKVQMLIVDESHRFKSPSAAKTRVLWSFNDVPVRGISTGTVQTKKKRAVDVYSQVKFENPQSPLVKNHTAATFKEDFAVWTRRNGYPQWLRARNSNRLRRLLHEEAYACTRRDAYGHLGDFPRLPDQIVPVDLTGHNLELYEQMAEEMIAKIKTGEITEASIRLVQSLRMYQLTGGIARTTPTAEHPKSRLLRVGRDKYNTLLDLANDWFEADEHVVVGARFHPDIDAARQICQKLKVPCFELHGKIKPSLRGNEWRTFNNTRGPACLVMQPAAGGLGIDLRSASIFVWFSLTNSWVDFTQAEDRIALNPDPRSYVYLLAKGTIDYLGYESLQEDGEIGRLVMKAPERLWVPGSGTS